MNEITKRFRKVATGLEKFYPTYTEAKNNAYRFVIEWNVAELTKRDLLKLIILQDKFVFMTNKMFMQRLITCLNILEEKYISKTKAS